MSSGLFTTSNLLIGAGALAVAAVGGGVLYTSIKKPLPDEKAILADAAFAKVDADSKNADGVSGEDALAEIAARNSKCPEDLAEIAANQGWFEVCGTGRPPAAANLLDGVWEVDSPGNPKIDDLIIYINNQYGLLHRGDPNQPSPARGVWRLKDAAQFASTTFSVPITVGEDGVVASRLGQFDYCNCGQLKWRVRQTSDPKMMIGEWRYDDEQGVSVWRKRLTKAVIRNLAIDKAFRTEQGEWSSDQFGYRSRAGRLERDHPVTCCDGVWVTILGENFAGNHNLWIDPATRVELWEATWLCKNGETVGESRWDQCGVGSNPGSTVAGIKIRLKLRDGMKPGPITLWVAGQPIQISVTLHGYPQEKTEKPELVTLQAYDVENNKLPSFTEGDPFILEAVFEGQHPDPWVNVDLPLKMRAAVANARDPKADWGGQPQIRSVTLRRMEDGKTFRSGQLAIQSAEAADE